jgi:hypothetical protein
MNAGQIFLSIHFELQSTFNQYLKHQIIPENVGDI